MNTLKDLATALRAGRTVMQDVALARKTGLTRQSVSRALSGEQNFSVTTLLALAEANGQEVVILPRGAARALTSPSTPDYQPVATVTSSIRDL